ncbi:hypothetical protein ON010_g5073 [Phytophthora cinnamomi]|nr:hypothetical protein ON010_g5073 [Phytophthora cinnamomi]
MLAQNAVVEPSELDVAENQGVVLLQQRAKHVRRLDETDRTVQTVEFRRRRFSREVDQHTRIFAGGGAGSSESSEYGRGNESE